MQRALTILLPAAVALCLPRQALANGLGALGVLLALFAAYLLIVAILLILLVASLLLARRPNPRRAVIACIFLFLAAGGELILFGLSALVAQGMSSSESVHPGELSMLLFLGLGLLLGLATLAANIRLLRRSKGVARAVGSGIVGGGGGGSGSGTGS